MLFIAVLVEYPRGEYVCFTLGEPPPYSYEPPKEISSMVGGFWDEGKC